MAKSKALTPDESAPSDLDSLQAAVDELIAARSADEIASAPGDGPAEGLGGPPAEPVPDPNPEPDPATLRPTPESGITATTTVIETVIPAGTITETTDPAQPSGCSGSIRPTGGESWGGEVVDLLLTNGLHARRNVILTNCRIDGWNSVADRITVEENVTATLVNCDIARGRITVKPGASLVTINPLYYGLGG